MDKLNYRVGSTPIRHNGRFFGLGEPVALTAEEAKALQGHVTLDPIQAEPPAAPAPPAPAESSAQAPAAEPPAPPAPPAPAALSTQAPAADPATPSAATETPAAAPAAEAPKADAKGKSAKSGEKA